MRKLLAILLGLTSAVGCGKLGVGSPSSSAGSSTASAVVPVVAPTPKIAITQPARGSFLAVGRAAVEGTVTSVSGSAIAAVDLAGQTLPVDPTGRFRTTIDLTSGLNVIEAQCVDAQGRAGAASIGVLAGDYKPVSQRVTQAGIGRLNAGTLDAFGKIAEAALWSKDWTTILKGLNPIFDSNLIGLKTFVNVEQVRFRGVTARLQPQAGGIFVTLDIAEPMIDVTCAAAFGSSPPFVTFPALATADLARLTAQASIAVRPDGSFATSFPNPVVDFQSFDLQASSNALVTAAVQLLAKGAIEKALREFIIESLRDDLPPFLDRSMAEVLQQQKPWDIYGKTFEFDLRGEQVSFDADGVSLSLGYNASCPQLTARGRAAPGSFTTSGTPPAVAPNRGFFLSLDDDGANRTFHAMWAGGIFDLDIDQAFLTSGNISLPIALEAGQLKRFLPEIGNAVPDGAPVKIHFEPGLPPIAKFTGAPDLVRIEAGEVALDVFVDRGSGWEKLLRTVVHMQMGANLALSSQGVQISSVSNPSFKFDLLEEPLVELDDRRLEVLLSVILTPTVPHIMNSAKVIAIPHLQQLAAFNVDLYADGPQREHMSVAGDMTR